MNWTMKLALMAVLAAVVMVAGVVPASADFALDTTREDYKSAMWYFVPTVAKWSTELQTAIETATVKPEQACELLTELEYRGVGLVEDLEGTTPPAEMADTHAALLDAIRSLTKSADAACTDPGEAQPSVDAQVQMVNGARHSLLTWLLANVGPIQITVQSVTGN